MCVNMFENYFYPAIISILNIQIFIIQKGTWNEIDWVNWLIKGRNKIKIVSISSLPKNIVKTNIILE